MSEHDTPDDVLTEMEPEPEQSEPEVRCTVSIEVEAGIDEDWQNCGLDAPPESAEALLAQIKDESRNSMHEFIRDWDLLAHVTITVSVARERADKPGRWEHTSARWDSNEPTESEDDQ